MKIPNIVLALFALMLFAFCCIGADAATPTKLDQLFQPATIGMKISAVEKLTGKVIKDHPFAYIDFYEYKVDGCKVYIYTTKAGDITGMTLNLSRKCYIKLDPFLAGEELDTRDMTLGKMYGESSILGAGKFVASCLDMCGNATDPDADFLFDGPHATDFVHVVLTFDLIAGDALDAADRVKTTMDDGDGEDYVVQNKFNCDNKYMEVANDAFDAVHVNRITIGYEPFTEQLVEECK